MALLRVGEMAEMLDLPVSTVIWKLDKAGIAAVICESKRQLFDGPQALAVLVNAYPGSLG